MVEKSVARLLDVMTDQETGLDEIIVGVSITIIIRMCNRVENPKFF
jgi:hypothetical protein